MPNKKQWLPSPSRTIGLLLFVILVVGALWFANQEDKSAQESHAIRIVGNEGEQIIEISDEDSDSDGLLDWEEALWGTDANNPDTDEDGTIDGKEVDAGRNPSIPAPGDTFDVTTLKLAQQNTAGTDTTTPKTHTELFSEAFISTYLNSKIVGVPFSSQMDTLSTLALPPLPPVTTHTTNELLIIKNASNDIIHSYGNAVGSILKENAPNVQNELVILLQAFKDNDPSILSDLNTTAMAYERNAEALLLIRVPQNIADTHIELINSFMLVSRDLRYMALLFNDSLSALAGMNSYFITSEKLISALSALTTFLEENTSFTPSEDGYVFMSTL